MHRVNKEPYFAKVSLHTCSPERDRHDSLSNNTGVMCSGC